MRVKIRDISRIGRLSGESAMARVDVLFSYINISPRRVCVPLIETKERLSEFNAEARSLYFAGTHSILVCVLLVYGMCGTRTQRALLPSLGLQVFLFSLVSTESNVSRRKTRFPYRELHGVNACVYSFMRDNTRHDVSL